MDQRCGSCKRELPLSSYSPSYRGRVGTWCRECFAAYFRGRRSAVPYKPVPHDPLVCIHCGKSYVPQQRKPKASFCSRECKDRSKKDRLIAERLAAKPDRQCLHCAGPLPRKARADAIFCSEDCNSKAHALQRKLRLRTGQDEKPGYLRAAICKRDKWRCQICGQRVNPKLEHPHPRAASLDHVVPVAEGGISEPGNLRLVHLVCNLRRRNVGGWEQLAFF